MTIRIAAIGAILFLLIAMTDRHKPMIKKCGRLAVAFVVLFANMIVDAGKASAVASYFQMDQLFMFAREVMYAFGLSGSTLISIQMFALSAVAMFTLLYMDCRATLCISKEDDVVEDKVQKQTYFSVCSNERGFLNLPCISTKRLN